MGEKARKIGDKLEGFGEKLFERFGWHELVRDKEIQCTKPKHKNNKDNSKRTHGVDIYHYFYDPYKGRKVGVITECKNYAWQSVNATSIQNWFNQLRDTIECAQSSAELQEYNEKCEVINTGILLVHVNDNGYNEETFRAYLRKLQYPSRRNPINIYIASNTEIEKWDSMFTYIENKLNQSGNFMFYNPSILSSGISKSEEISLNQLFSSFVFAQSSYETDVNVNGMTCKNNVKQQIVFSFDKITVESFNYICDMFKELQLQNEDEYVFCFYPECKEDIDLINRKFMDCATESFKEKKEIDKIKTVILDNRRISPVDKY